MKKIIAVAVLALTIAGCSYLNPAEVALSDMVETYCKAPEAGRKVVRNKVNGFLKPNSIHITCENDQG